MLIRDGLSAERRDQPDGMAGTDFRLSKEGRTTALFAALALAWLLCDAVLLTPAFGGLDIYYFKDPGANFAQGLGFVSRFTYGNPSLDYRTYSQYPPLYPLLYGLFASVGGVSLLSNQLFNSSINLLCAIIGFSCLAPLLRARDAFGTWHRIAPWVQTGIFIAAIVMGFFKPEQDRPDALAVMTAGIALLLIRDRLTNGRLFTACALCALTFFISPFVSIWASIAVFVVAAAAMRAHQHDLATIGRLAISGAAGGLLTATVALTLIAILIPDWFGGFAGVVTGASTRNETGGGYFMLLLHGDIHGWAGAFRDFTRHGAGTLYLNLGKLVLVQGALALATIWEWRQARISGERWQGLPIVGLLLASPLCLVIMPYQFTYLRITAALLLMAAACVTVTMRRGTTRPYALAILCTFAGITATAIPKTAVELASRAVAGPSLKRAEAAIRAQDFAANPPGRFLAVSSPTYMLWRQEGVRPLAIVFSGFADDDARRHVDTLALSYARSVNPRAPELPEWFSADEYAPVSAPVLPQIYDVAGLPLGSGSITWESAIFSRRSH